MTNTTQTMDKVESTSADKSSGAGSRRLANIQLAQNVLLIWLDSNIDMNDPDCRNPITQLRCVVNSINTCTDSSENVCMIISAV
jgi:hypothetical protein